MYCMYECKETLKRIQKEREYEEKIREILLQENSAKYTLSRFGGLLYILKLNL
jgi:hypothetical protein